MSRACPNAYVDVMKSTEYTSILHISRREGRGGVVGKATFYKLHRIRTKPLANGWVLEHDCAWKITLFLAFPPSTTPSPPPSPHPQVLPPPPLTRLPSLALGVSKQVNILVGRVSSPLLAHTLHLVLFTTSLNFHPCFLSKSVPSLSSPPTYNPKHPLYFFFFFLNKMSSPDRNLLTSVFIPLPTLTCNAWSLIWMFWLAVLICLHVPLR